jgi:hypothetical protein
VSRAVCSFELRAASLPRRRDWSAKGANIHKGCEKWPEGRVGVAMSIRPRVGSAGATRAKKTVGSGKPMLRTAMRKLLHLIHGVLNNQLPFGPYFDKQIAFTP